MLHVAFDAAIVPILFEKKLLFRTVLSHVSLFAQWNSVWAHHLLGWGAKYIHSMWISLEYEKKKVLFKYRKTLRRYICSTIYTQAHKKN